MQFQSKVTPEEMEILKRRFLDFPDITHDERSRRVAKEFPKFTANTLKSYSRMCLGASEKVFSLYLEGKVSLAVPIELASWNKGEQDFIIDEYLEKKFTPETLRKIRRYRDEHKCGYAEAIARATGAIDAKQPRKTESRRSVDTILTEIADKGARWRAMVAQVLEMIGQEEASAGIHEALFVKVLILRDLIGNQYDFVNGKVNRYMNTIRKRLQNGGPSPAQVEGTVEGEIHGDGAGAGEGRVGGEEGAPREDGPPVPDHSGKGQG
jgi:hypothetical protein